MKHYLLLPLAALLSCSAPSAPDKASGNTQSPPAPPPPQEKEAPVGTPGEILSRAEIPVLCYHDLKDWPAGLSATNQSYYVPPAKFRAQMQLLADSGYQTILPRQYMDYLERGTPLPPKPVMITFDDGDREQFSVGAGELEKHGFKGVFFIMTIAIGKKNYLQSEEIRELARRGHEIGLHTWDHSGVKEYNDSDWVKQVVAPKKRLEDLIGDTVTQFAYPFGLWNGAAPPKLKEAGIRAAYQLNAERRDTALPLYSLRRMIVHGAWDAQKMLRWMKINFKGPALGQR